MRLIDIDVLGVGRCNPDVFKVPGRAEGWNSLLDIVNSAPTIDAVEVVRCKDCEYYHLMEEGFYDCREVWGLDLPQPEDFCSYGKRREENNEN